MKHEGDNVRLQSKWKCHIPSTYVVACMARLADWFDADR